MSKKQITLISLRELVWRKNALSGFDDVTNMPLSVRNLPTLFLRELIGVARNRLIRIRRRLLKFEPYKIVDVNFWKSRNFVKSCGCSQIGLFAARPNPKAGFGHQMSTVLSGMEMAGSMSLEFTLSGLPPKWDRELGFDLKTGSHTSEIKQQIFLPPTGFTHQDTYAHFLYESLKGKLCGCHLVWGPFDHSQEDLTISGEMLRKLYQTNRVNQFLQKPQLVVHLRKPRTGKGDFTESDIHRIVDEDRIFSEIIPRALDLPISSDIQEILILSTDYWKYESLLPSLCKEYGIRVSSTTGCCEIGAFRKLATCRVLIGSPSGFSYVAALLNTGTVFFPKHFWHTQQEYWNLY